MRSFLPEGGFYIYSIIESNLLAIPLERFLDEVIQAGVSVIQLRDKFETDSKRYETARLIKKFIDKKDISFIINDSVDLAIATVADGVHLGVKDIPIEVAKANFPNLIFGYSCNNLDDLAKANQYADYAGVGPCYPTDTKKDLRAILSKDDIKMIIESAKVQTFAIGGINRNNIADVKSCGVDGVVLASYLLKSEEPYVAIKTLLDNLNERV